MDYIINSMGIILYMVQGYFFYKSVSCFLEPRVNKICLVVAGIIGVFVCIMVIFPRDIFNITANIPLFLLMLIIGFKPKWLVKISVFLLLFPIIITVNFLTMDIGGRIWVEVFQRHVFVGTLIGQISVVATLLFWYLFQKQAGGKIRDMATTLDNKSWLLLDAICLASLAAVISFVYYTPQETYKVWLGMFACLITNVSAIRLVFYLAENIRGKLEQKHAKLQQDYYKELEIGQCELRKFRHDMNNHFSVVAELLEEGNEEAAKEYFHKLSGELRARGRSFCKNSIVNAVLNSKYNRTMEAEIDCFFHIEIDELLFIEPMDICTMFSNTLDNAIEACRKVGESNRSISVKARCTENGYFSYEIKNTMNQEIQIENGKYKSWKKEKKSHGIGLENVQDVVKKYSGTIDITHDAEEFCVVILIAEGSKLS